MAARFATVADVEALGFIPSEREEQRYHSIEMKLSKVLPTFEKDDSGTVDVRDVGTIIRAMNINPTETLIESVVKAIEEPESTGYVHISKLRPVIAQMCLNREYNGTVLSRDSEETIVQAFQLLDRDNKGYIEAEYLKQVMTEQGEKFNNEEILEMINAACDPETGHIYYDDFAAILATE